MARLSDILYPTEERVNALKDILRDAVVYTDERGEFIKIHSVNWSTAMQLEVVDLDRGPAPTTGTPPAMVKPLTAEEYQLVLDCGITIEHVGMSAHAMLKKGADLVVARSTEYGDATETYRRVAASFNALYSQRLTAAHVMFLMVLIKTARAQQSPENYDHYMDAAVYMTLMGQLPQGGANPRLPF